MIEISPPLWLLAELTYACPLQCPYCSNPVDFARYKNELMTSEWCQVLEQARSLGIVQLGFSGGEPAVRQDLVELVSYARQLGFYSNLITSSIGLTEKKIHALKQAGLDSVQISFQAASQPLNDAIAKTSAFEHKVQMAKVVKAAGLPLIFNCVLTRYNIDSIEQIIELALSLKADFVELANTQYYGFAQKNFTNLLPSKSQLINAEKIANRYQKRKQSKVKIYYIVSDYYEERPKACMGGWGKISLTVTPDGYVLPCLAARSLPGLDFPNVREQTLPWIWNDSSLFNRYRGFDWMKDPCRTCPERSKDFGGCRCQAFLLTGNADNADPVCKLSPAHGLLKNKIQSEVSNSPLQNLIFRNPHNSKIMR